MTPVTISPATKTAPGFVPFLHPGAPANKRAANKTLHTLPAMPKNYPGRSIVALVHEVRNPLANIDLSIEMLAAAITDESLRPYLDIIQRNSKRINNLVTELLVSRPADKTPVAEHSIHQLLDEVLEMAGDRLLLKNISVRKEYAAADCRMALNRSNLKIALTNIIVNAIDAMSAQKGKLMLVTKSTDNKFILQIEDNGCGIGKDDLKNIFKPYFTRKPGGLGLGLATTNDILRSNHVEVFVASEEGIGTRFVLMFDKSYSS